VPAARVLGVAHKAHLGESSEIARVGPAERSGWEKIFPIGKRDDVVGVDLTR
jgi:hypothetical protein